MWSLIPKLGVSGNVWSGQLELEKEPIEVLVRDLGFKVHLLSWLIQVFFCHVTNSGGQSSTILKKKLKCCGYTSNTSQGFSDVGKDTTEWILLSSCHCLMVPYSTWIPVRAGRSSGEEYTPSLGTAAGKSMEFIFASTLKNSATAKRDRSICITHRRGTSLSLRDIF